VAQKINPPYDGQGAQMRCLHNQKYPQYQFNDRDLPFFPLLL